MGRSTRLRAALYVAMLGTLAAGAGSLAGVGAQAPAPAFSIDDVAGPEYWDFTFTVTLANPPATEARVRFKTVSGTAAPGTQSFNNFTTIDIPGSGTGSSPTGAAASVYPLS